MDLAHSCGRFKWYPPVYVLHAALLSFHLPARLHALHAMPLLRSQAGSSFLWAFLVGAYWLSIVCWVTLYWSYNDVTALRNRLRASDQSLQPAEFAVLLRDVPGKPPSDHKEEGTPAAGGGFETSSLCQISYVWVRTRNTLKMDRNVYCTW